MIITPDDYQHDERAKELADRVLADADVSPHECFEVWLDEGGAVISRYRVTDARMVNGHPVLSFKLRPDGKAESYRTVKTRHGWVDVDDDGTVPSTGAFR